MVPELPIMHLTEAKSRAPLQSVKVHNGCHGHPRPFPVSQEGNSDYFTRFKNQEATTVANKLIDEYGIL